MTKLEHLNSILEYYEQSASDGRRGMQAEVSLRAYMTDNVSRIRPLGVTDIVVRAGIALECKTGCGWLIPPIFDSSEDALAYYNETRAANRLPIRKAIHIAYVQSFKLDRVHEFRVYKQREFLEILEACNLIRAKRPTEPRPDGTFGYGITIQSFKNSASKWAKYDELLMNAGMTIDDYITQYIDEYDAR